MAHISRRMRRNRKSSIIREMVAENTVRKEDLIFPLFLIQGEKAKSEIQSMPGIFRLGTEALLREVEECMELGLRAFAPFPSFNDEQKDTMATVSHDPENFYLQAVREIKKRFPETCIITDVAMDPYSSDGHDGIVQDGEILNDETLEVLAAMANAQADAGADIIAPSDMMDGRIEFLRDSLDEQGFSHVNIMAYTAKYASAFYGPFRDALDSAPKSGDKKTYQMNPANSREAITEAELDYLEGADFLMVKPGLPYLDIIGKLRERFDVPIAAYNVSGEYAMLKAAGQNGWLDADACRDEALTCFKRAGADVILTYFAKEFAQAHQ